MIKIQFATTFTTKSNIQILTLFDLTGIV